MGVQAGRVEWPELSLLSPFAHPAGKLDNSALEPTGCPSNRSLIWTVREKFHKLPGVGTTNECAARNDNSTSERRISTAKIMKDLRIGTIVATWETQFPQLHTLKGCTNLMSTTTSTEERQLSTQTKLAPWSSKFELAIHDAGVSCNMLTCDFQNGYLTIRGAVKTYFEKQVAQEAVRQLPGVNLIQNELKVRGV